MNEYRAGRPDAIVAAVAVAVAVAVAEASLAAVRNRRAPVVNTKTVASRLHISEVAAQNATDRLAGAEVLTMASAGRRNRIWQAPENLTALDAFDARAIAPE